VSPSETKSFRFACDTGGTFTDLIVESDNLRMYKAHTVPSDPTKGVLDALRVAAADHELTLEALLQRGELFVHGTTHAINAIITQKTARTGFIVTEGHPDILVIREGGKSDAFDFTTFFPDPYVPRALTFEVEERIAADGSVRKPLNEADVISVIKALKREKVEAVAVCLLWSIINPDHEKRIGELLAEHMPNVPVTLSHALNPTLREYRRASSTVIDASLKPVMAKYLGNLESRLKAAGFAGRVLVLTSQGGTMDAGELSRAPIHAINSGPSMAPVAGRHFARLDLDERDVIVADTGGTTYDVSLVRGGQIPWTRETWIGAPYKGHMTGFPSVDVKSVGAGGGSIAWVDAGGVLHVGPQSAGSTPGPACYGMGGLEATVSDACVVLGYIDPDYFLGGSVKLDAEAARQAVGRIASRLSVSLEAAAASIVQLVTENMVQAIVDITVNQGVDASEAILIGGGGAAGLNSIFIARRLGCRHLVFPELGAALSAAGALMSDLTAEYRQTFITSTANFDMRGTNAVLQSLGEQCQTFQDGPAENALSHNVRFSVEARYPGQVWEIEAPLSHGRFSGPDDVKALTETFHAAHKSIFAVNDPTSVVEIVGWSAKVSSRFRDTSLGRLAVNPASAEARTVRSTYFAGAGWIDTPRSSFEGLKTNQVYRGPMIVESPFTTIVLDPQSRFHLTDAGSVIVSLEQERF
jgi:N-methylhydantoinase A